MRRSRGSSAARWPPSSAPWRGSATQWKHEWADAVGDRPAKPGPRHPAPAGSAEYTLEGTGAIDAEALGRIVRNMASLG